MPPARLNSLDLLDRLIAFASVSSAPNQDIVGWIVDFLDNHGFTCRRLPDSTGRKEGILARIGPDNPGGVMLSAHLDVVPVEGQSWSRDPFRLTREGGRLYGRGTTDMKGFVAATLNVAQQAAAADLAQPLYLILSYDEELGCLGLPQMLPHLPATIRPRLCIVGEPTQMQIATGHKGKCAFRATFRGQAGHSAMAPNFTNALHLAADFIGFLRAEQEHLARTGARDGAYDIPYSTLHAGRMAGGVALNIVPDHAFVDFELRHLASDPPGPILKRLRAALPEGTSLSQVNAYPGLDLPVGAPEVTDLARFLENPTLIKVAYGTEAGFFAAHGFPTLICGPGSMAQGHQPDEYLEESQLHGCDRMLARLIEELSR
ncbi:MAG: acetylornithine deacetylase [Rhodobacteraceae bacterium]|nr:acetylornithine deacetylase [Paracoccaceae bacterium]